MYSTVPLNTAAKAPLVCLFCLPQIIYKASLFKDSAEGLQHVLRLLGVNSSVAELEYEADPEIHDQHWQQVFQEAGTLFFVFTPHRFKAFPQHFVALQMEQASNVDMTTDQTSYMHSAVHVWDFSPYNVHKFTSKLQLQPGKMVVMPVYFQDNDLQSLQTDDTGQDIDVLFYGLINPRRYQLGTALLTAGLAVKFVQHVFGPELHALIARAKIVINVHYYPDAALEVHRINQLLQHGKCIVSEHSIDTQLDAAYSEGVVFVSYDGMVAEVQRLLANPRARRQWEWSGQLLGRRIQTNLKPLRNALLQVADRLKDMNRSDAQCSVPQ